jgi:hypothetical protein
VCVCVDSRVSSKGYNCVRLEVVDVYFLHAVNVRLEMFKNDFKFYKRRRPPPDLSGVLDLSQDFCNSAVSELYCLFFVIVRHMHKTRENKTVCFHRR